MFFCVVGDETLGAALETEHQVVSVFPGISVQLLASKIIHAAGRDRRHTQLVIASDEQSAHTLALELIKIGPFDRPPVLVTTRQPPQELAAQSLIVEPGADVGHTIAAIYAVLGMEVPVEYRKVVGGGTVLMFPGPAGENAAAAAADEPERPAHLAPVPQPSEAAEAPAAAATQTRDEQTPPPPASQTPPAPAPAGHTPPAAPAPAEHTAPAAPVPAEHIPPAAPPAPAEHTPPAAPAPAEQIPAAAAPAGHTPPAAPPAPAEHTPPAAPAPAEHTPPAEAPVPAEHIPPAAPPAPAEQIPPAEAPAPAEQIPPAEAPAVEQGPSVDATPFGKAMRRAREGSHPAGIAPTLGGTPDPTTTAPRDPLAGPVGNVLCVTAAKGGVGKSSLALWAAERMTDCGLKVCVVDANIAQPDLLEMTGSWASDILGLASLVRPAGQTFTPAELDAALISVDGLGDLLPGPPAAARTVKESSLRTAGAAIEHLRSQYQWVVVDTPVSSGFETAVETIISPYADLVLVVVTPFKPTVLDTLRFLDLAGGPLEEGGYAMDMSKFVGVLNTPNDVEVGLSLGEVESYLAQTLRLEAAFEHVTGASAAVNKHKWRCPRAAQHQMALLINKVTGVAAAPAAARPQRKSGLFRRNKR